MTALCLEFNPANYTVWHFRRQCLTDQQLTPEILDQDLDLASRLGGANPKNYQIWYHRRALLETSGLEEDRARKELSYVATVLDEDAKNYHVSMRLFCFIEYVESSGRNSTHERFLLCSLFSS